jgi:pyridinium-3,5-biscarboxylic acid mononucleotide synthase
VDEKQLIQLLEGFRDGQVSQEQALQLLRKLPFDDIDIARLDSHRGVRNGFPEVVLCQGKKTSHIVRIMERLCSGPGPVLATRADVEVFREVQAKIPGVQYHDLARAMVFEPNPLPKRKGRILTLTAGTADIPVAEEAAVTAEIMGNVVDRLFDVGVAGLHRLLADLDRIQSASVLIVVAGMEGALPSVVGGLVNRPVIAVPTSVGYGASFNGLAALLAMLNTCSAGVTVVNIDNGFGAGYAASQINALSEVSYG